jgi:hypothetical protein
LNTHLDTGTWEPRFPNARYLYGRPGPDHAAAVPAEPMTGDLNAAAESETFATRSHRTQVNVYKQSIKPIIDAGRADIVDTRCERCRD